MISLVSNFRCFSHKKFFVDNITLIFRCHSHQHNRHAHNTTKHRHKLSWVYNNTNFNNCNHNSHSHQHCKQMSVNLICSRILHNSVYNSKSFIRICMSNFDPFRTSNFARSTNGTCFNFNQFDQCRLINVDHSGKQYLDSLLLELAKHNTDSSNRSNQSSHRSLFGENLSWNETVKNAQMLSNYQMDLYRKLFHDYQLSKLIDYKKLQHNDGFHQFVRHYFRTYNYQITGLITVLFTKLFLYSSHLLPELTTEKITYESDQFVQIESQITKLAECYDLISYGFFFHDTISYPESASIEKALKNLLILLGDYFLVKSSYDVAMFNRVDLYQIYVNTVANVSEGQSLWFDMSDSDEMKIVPTSIDHSESGNTSEQTEKFIDYCYLTNGHLLASSLQSAFNLANFGEKAQLLAFEFGKNIGIAIKISNQISAHFCAEQIKSQQFNDTLNENEQSVKVSEVIHFNLSYFVKFPMVSVNVMQTLAQQYLNKSISLLQTLVNYLPSNRSDSSLPPPPKKTDQYSLPHTVVNVDQLSPKSLTLMQILIRLINEIDAFNHSHRNDKLDTTSADLVYDSKLEKIPTPSSSEK